MIRSALFIAAVFLCGLPAPLLAADSYASIVAKAQPRQVKIYGAGGVRGLEPYQSGFIISADGHILTVHSYVLDTDYITVTLSDGRKYQAEFVGRDPQLEIAILKIDASELSHYNLNDAASLDTGSRVLAFSNLYGVATGDEPSSVLHGQVSVKTKLAARRGAFKTPYKGDVYVLDAMTNNPGAAGGALTDRRGNIAGILGKELRNAQNNTWLNYALPISALTASVDKILRGENIPLSSTEDARPAADPLSLDLLGITLVPEVLPKTPPFIDKVLRDSPAANAGLKADDLVLFCNESIVTSCEVLRKELSLIDRDEEIEVTVQRGQELVIVKLRSR